MRCVPHEHVDLAVLEVLQDALLLLGGDEPVHEFDADGPVGEALLEGGRVLARQERRGREDGDLAARHDGLERGADGHFGLAETDIAAHEAIHGTVALEIDLRFFDRARLVGREIPLERVLELALEVVVGRERFARGHGALRVQLDEFADHLVDGLARLLLEEVPGLAAELVQLRRLRVVAAPLLDLDEVGDRHAQAVLALVLQYEDVDGLVPRDDALDPQVLPDAVGLVDDEVALLQGFDVGEGRAPASAHAPHASGEAVEDLVVGPPGLSVAGEVESGGEMAHDDSRDGKIFDNFRSGARPGPGSPKGGRRCYPRGRAPGCARPLPRSLFPRVPARGSPPARIRASRRGTA